MEIIVVGGTRPALAEARAGRSGESPEESEQAELSELAAPDDGQQWPATDEAATSRRVARLVRR